MAESICVDSQQPPPIIELQEHQKLDDSIAKLLEDQGVKFREAQYECAPEYLGVHPETLCASYYIGAEWLVDGECALIVTPKIPNIDFIEMFICALQFEKSSTYFSKFYGIDFEKPPIKTNAFSQQLTPLIIIHYLYVLKRLIKRGLKKDYVVREENLQSKIRGKIKLPLHLIQNTMRKREDRIYCRYLEYCDDSLENRLLKKTLQYVETYVDTLSHTNLSTLKTLINSIKPAFRNVSDAVNVNDIKTIHVNKIYKEHAMAIKLAKMILRKFNYSLANVVTDMNVYTPSFWIDMSRLYEVYVYAKLYEKYGDDIKFQVSGHYHTVVDMVDVRRKIIIDTKYKPRYGDGNKGIVDDIRQISAYARDTQILKILQCGDNKVVDCLIIYPERTAANEYIEQKDCIPNEYDDCNELKVLDNIDNLLEHATAINGYNGFFKLSIPLPCRSV